MESNNRLIEREEKKNKVFQGQMLITELICYRETRTVKFIGTLTCALIVSEFMPTHSKSEPMLI